VATLPLIVDGELYLLARLSSTSSDKIPKAPSWIQYFGSTAEYFSSLLVCCGLRRNTTRDLETSFRLPNFGRTWYFVLDPRDMAKVVRSSERNVRFYKGLVILLLAGKLLLPTRRKSKANIFQTR
jgi:hypothetical protein